VAGEAFIPGGGGFAFLYRDGVVTSLGTLGTSARPASQARGINDHGRVVGYYCSDSAFGAFLWDKGTMRDLGGFRRGGKPGYGIAHAINDAGRVVGEASSPGGHGHAFLWRDGGMTDLGVLSDEPGIASAARGINRRGEVVGFSGMVEGNEHRVRGFLWREGQGMVALPTLGGRDSQANAFNDRGQVVGRSGVRTPGVPPAIDRDLVLPADRAHHAFLFEGGTMRDLGTLGGKDSEALAINRASAATPKWIMAIEPTADLRASVRKARLHLEGASFAHRRSKVPWKGARKRGSVETIRFSSLSLAAPRVQL
jgi:probable HAF family extracellular repeat protein